MNLSILPKRGYVDLGLSFKIQKGSYRGEEKILITRELVETSRPKPFVDV